jgi:hypothetical protein
MEREIRRVSIDKGTLLMERTRTRTSLPPKATELRGRRIEAEASKDSTVATSSEEIK